MAHDTEQAKELKGIGGWLILPLLELIVTPPWNGFSLFRPIEVYSDFSTFKASFQIVFAVQVVLIFLLGVLLPIYLLVKMFKHSAGFPRLWIISSLLSATYTAVMTAVFLLLFKEDVAAGTFEPFNLFDIDVIVAWASALSIVIGIPYMLRSKRVANTFR